MATIAQDQLDQLIEQAQSGDIAPLVAALKGRPMSPSGFMHTEAGSFGDGEMDDRSWMIVQSAVLEGKLDEATFNRIHDACFGP